MSLTLQIDSRNPVQTASRCAAAIPSGGVLYYALGGGVGHLARAIAVSRRWERLRPEPFAIFSNCAAPVEAPGVHLRLAEREPSPDDLAALVAELVRAIRPGVLAVDAFPAGILGELPRALPRLHCAKVAILRRLQPQWSERWGLPELLATEYVEAVAIEEPLGFSVDGLRAIGPVLTRDPSEVLSRGEAREMLGHQDERPLIVVATTGMRPADQGLQGLSVRIAERLGAAVRLATPHPPGPLPAAYVRHFPLMELLPAADLVIGPCGYNLFHETRALGIPAVWVPQPRRYDDQFARAEGSWVARSPEELEFLAGAALRGDLGAPPAPREAGGAAEAARLLADLCRGG